MAIRVMGKNAATRSITRDAQRSRVLAQIGPIAFARRLLKELALRTGVERVLRCAAAPLFRDTLLVGKH